MPNHKDAKDNTDEVLVAPIPDNAPPLPKTLGVCTEGHWDNYPIILKWPYHDPQGRLLFYVARAETIDSKVTPMYTLWKAANGKLTWRQKGFPCPRPLFNLHLLVAYPEAEIIFVEGEKCAKAFQDAVDGADLRNKLIIMTWPLGTNGVRHADFSTIKNRKVKLWEDHDRHPYPDKHPKAGQEMPRDKQPGHKAMIEVAALLDKSNKIKLVRPPVDKPDGWDVADAIQYDKWDIDRILSFIDGNLEDVPKISPHAKGAGGGRKGKNPRGPIPAEELLKQADLETGDIIEWPLRFLGTNDDRYYYVPQGTGQVKDVRGGGHTPNELLALAPLDFWETTFTSDKKGTNWKAAADAVMRECERHGLYSPLRLRGRGAWYDNGQSVLNLGNLLIVNGVKIRIADFQSEFIYEAGPPLEHELTQPIPFAKAAPLLEICRMLPWEKKIFGDFLAGWIVVGLICGALKCRPHIWITGASGTGKTTTLDKILKPILGKFAIFMQSTTTSAGLRQIIGSDSLAVMLDEFEGEDAHAQVRVQSVLELARQAFSETGAHIVKGTPNGRAILYLVRSAFCISSIGVNIHQHADETRITVLSLKMPHDVDELTPRQHFGLFTRRIEETFTPDWCNGFRARCVCLIPVIRKNAEILAAVISGKLGSQRAGDQIGTIMAGVYSLLSDKEITPGDAAEWIDRQDLTEQKECAGESDEMNCLGSILSSQVNIGRSDQRTIGELIESANSEKEAKIVDAETLARYGMKIARLPKAPENSPPYLYIANKNTSLESLLRGSTWSGNWPRILARLPGAEKTEVTRFAGSRSRAVALPLPLIVDGSVDGQAPDSAGDAKNDNTTTPF